MGFLNSFFPFLKPNEYSQESNALSKLKNTESNSHNFSSTVCGSVVFLSLTDLFFGSQESKLNLISFYYLACELRHLNFFFVN